MNDLVIHGDIQRAQMLEKQASTQRDQQHEGNPLRANLSAQNQVPDDRHGLLLIFGESLLSHSPPDLSVSVTLNEAVPEQKEI